MTRLLAQQADLLDLAAPNERAGFRLQKLELYNWGTFDGRVWQLHAGGETSLLTGDIGSGKSTVVDALTTLLVAPQRLTYNKAAGAEARERTVRSYVLGHYKAERSETGSGAKPVSLRDANSYSVLLAHFFNQGYEQHVTLAQVFWTRELEGQPARLFLVADRHLTIAEHFSSFTDIGGLKKRLRGLTKEVHDSFPPYQSAFRKRFGIQNDQALELFHQTVSMKSVGNLTDFVRQHMLQPFPVEERIDALVRHVDDLTRAHEAVLRAKAQLERLTPLVADLDQHEALEGQVHEARACREALRAWFASTRLGLLMASMDELDQKHRALLLEVEQLEAAQRLLGEKRDVLRLDIHNSGGGRLEHVRAEIAARVREKQDRERRAAGYERNAGLVNLSPAPDGQSFLANQRALESLQPETDARLAALHGEEVEASVRFAGLRGRQEELSTEVDSLRKRRSSIPSQLLALRAQLCAELDVPEDDLPFCGELIQVHEAERAWEGAIERVLHGFGTSLSVPDEHYGRVSLWVDKTNLGGRLVYFRVRDAKQGRSPALEPASLVRKLTLKHDSPLSGWLEGELARRFNLVCCDSIDQFRREPHALTRAGQVKQGGVQHTKDDRHRVDDRTRFVLGWSNQEKLAVLERELGAVEEQARRLGDAIAGFATRRRALETRLDALKALSAQTSFADIDWRSVVLELERLQTELRDLEASSDLLRTLERQLRGVDEELAGREGRLKEARDRTSRLDERRKSLSAQHTSTRAVVDATTAEEAARFPRLVELHAQAPGARPITLETADATERDLRTRLQAHIDAEDQRLGRLRDRIIKAMQDYRGAYPIETRETDASLAA
ncbi:MAG: ATP-binding protein, partial [Myxococcaceae bacterium]